MPLSIPFAQPAFADHVTERGIDIACPADQVSDNPYTDVDDNDTSARPISCLTDYNIAKGTTPTTYNPGGNVLRRQMALFIYRIGLQAGVEFDTTTDPGFSDDNFGTGIAAEETKDAVWGLANADVVLGTTPTTFSPNELVSRAQMASFIARIQDEIGVENFGAGADDYFDDDEQSVHEANINRIAEEGITIGTGGRNYGPLLAVTRRQMAFFLARKLDLLVELGFVNSAYDGQNATATAGAVENGQFTLTVAGTDVDSVTVSGDCIETQTFTGDSADDSQDFTVLLADDAAAGNCTITVVTSFTDASGKADETDTVTVNVPAQQSNQDFTINPAADQSKTASTVGGDEAETFFTVTGLDNAQRYDIRLFACNDVTTTADGVTTFRDDENTDADADLEGNNQADNIDSSDTGAAEITSVNNNDTLTVGDNITPVNGTITFSVNSEQADCAVAVVFEDVPDNDVLELDANNQPTSPFVNTGDLVFTPRNATTGGFTGAEAVSTDEANDRFTADTGGDGVADAVFAYDSNDQFNIPGLTGASLAQFEAALTPGDVLNIQYNADPAGVSTFTITTNTTPEPENVAASVTNADGDATANDVVITFTPGDDTPSGTTFVVNRFTVTPAGDGTCPAATTVNTTAAGTVTDTTNTDTTATDPDLAPGCYAYTVTATSPNGGTAETSEFSNTVQVVAPVAPDTTAPDLTSATANDVNDGVGSTNQVRFNFNEPVTVLDATDFSVTSGGITFQGTTATVSGNTVIVTLNGTLNDAATDQTYTANVAAGAVEDGAGNDNAADSATFAY